MPSFDFNNRWHHYEAIASGIVVQSPAGDVLYANSAALNMLGMSRQQIQEVIDGKSEVRILFEEDSPISVGPKSTLFALADGKPGESTVLGLSRPGGAAKWFLFSSQPVFSRETGEILEIVSTFIDITERKHAEEELRRSENQYRQLVAMANEGVWVINADAVTTFVNPRMAEMLGYPANEIVGKSIFAFMDDKGIELARAGLDRQKTGIRERQNLWFYRKDGTRIEVLLGISPIQDETGHYTGALALVTDITEQKKAENGLRRMNRALKVLSESNQAVVRATEENSLLGEICRIVVETGGYLMAWVGYAEHDAAKSIRPVARYGYDAGYLDSLWFSWDDVVNGRGPAGTAVRTGKAHIIRDVQTDPALAICREEALQRGYASVIGLPLTDKDRVFGAITIYASEKDAFDSEEVDLLKELANDLSFGILSLRAREERKKAREALLFAQFSLDRASDAVFWMDDKGEFFYVNDAACYFLGYTREELLSFSVKDVDGLFPRERWPGHWEELKRKGSLTFESLYRAKDGRTFPVEVTGNFLKYNGKEYVCVFARNIAERKRVEEALRENEEKFRSLVENTNDWFWEIDRDFKFTYSSPRVWDFTGYRPEEVLGKTLFDLMPYKEELRLRDRLSETLLAQKSFAFLENTLLHKNGSLVEIETNGTPVFNQQGVFCGYRGTSRDVTGRKKAEKELRLSLERLRRSVEETIAAIATALEIRDPYTAGHQRRVAQLVYAIAMEMGLPRDRVEGARLAAVIHDIGKIYTPAEILAKPGKITEIELSMIRVHPQVGYDILKKIEFPWPIADAVLQHHERLNGSGYPSGLTGDAIILEARILGVADVVEAMSSHRPYRPALGIDKALQEIADNRGVLYDPAVVDICLRLFKEKSFVFDPQESAR